MPWAFPAQVNVENVVANSKLLIHARNLEPMKNQGVPTFMQRHELDSVLGRDKMTVGVERGVQRGIFCKQKLENSGHHARYHG
jgi:hypothetical protein